jgi:FtsP/CotA-like multicopper oxidase with cupredoxin domain
MLVICGGVVALAASAWNGLTRSTAGEVDFVRPLPIPPLASSRVDSSGRRVFDLTAAPGRHDFGDRTARTWGFNGDYLGPTLRATRGERVTVNVRNGLDQPTTVHWHGMHLPAAMDGGPHQPVRPGTTWSPSWVVDQPAATLWYHPHPHGSTAHQVYQGLAGLFLVDDPTTDVAALPHRYGVDDIPLVVQDKNFTDSGDLDEGERFLSGVGILGDTIVVNGVTGPYLDVTSTRVRLRLLNASNARRYEFGFVDDREFTVVASDGGLLARAFDVRRVALAAGERAEVVVTVRPGERAVLRSFPATDGLGLMGRFSGGADTLDILELRAAARLSSSPDVPRRLVDLPRLDASAAVRRRSFRLADRSINGERVDPGRVDVTAVVNTTEVWQVTNADGSPHSFHIHDVQFQVARVDGRPPGPELSGWKDTLFLRPGRRYDLVVPFADHSDPHTPYMFHCHVLAHEDEGMMGQFVVVPPGGRADLDAHRAHHG